jgi:cobalt-zinc-cadmium resistance protein CzcA
VRGLGVLTSLKDIENIVLTQQGGLPVLLSDVAKIQVGFRPRLGISGRDDNTDVVNGIVLMQKFERTMEVVTPFRLYRPQKRQRVACPFSAPRF